MRTRISLPQSGRPLILLLINHVDDLLYTRRELIKAIQEKKMELIVSCPYDSRLELFPNHNIYLDFVKIDRRGANPFTDFQLLLHYARLGKFYKPKVVLSYSMKPNVYGGAVCRLLKIPHIANISGLGDAVENPGLIRKILLFLLKYSISNSFIVFFQNIENKKFFESQSIVSHLNSRLVNGSGVNLKLHSYEKYPNISGHIRILFIGRILQDKGVTELIQAAKIIHNNKSTFSCDFVGFYEDATLRKLLEDYQNSGAGTYLGVCDDIHKLIMQYHAVILPSYHEGMANVLLEAAACGRPVLASNVPGCQEAFDEGISGFGFEPRSVDSLVDAIERFIALPHEQKVAMGLAGRKKMEREFDRQVVVDVYMREIEKFLDENRK